jgi:hypothetical protein
LVICGALGFPHPALQAQYAVKVLDSGGTESIAYSEAGGQQSGLDSGSATLWTGSSASAVNLNPVGSYSSFAYATNGTQQGGSANFVDANGTDHAMLWSGTAASFVDLHPAGAASSYVLALSATQQAGSAFYGGYEHAMVWSGSAASAVDLQPAGAMASEIAAMSASQQGGFANIGGSPHAALWSGSAATFVDLHPPGASISSVNAMNGFTQAGAVYFDRTPYAALWSGTADSFTNIDPGSGGGSAVYALAGPYAAGIVFQSTGEFHAGFWQLGSRVFSDLQPIITAAVGATYTSSVIRGAEMIGSTLYLTGEADDLLNQNQVAILITIATSLSNPLTNASVTTGQTAAFSAGPTNSAIQWQISLDQGSTWSNLADDGTYHGTATATLTITDVGPLLNNAQYRYVAKTLGIAATSTSATLAVQGLSDQLFLQQLFLRVLGRPIDPGGAASFGAALAGGESRSAVLGGLLNSSESSLRQIEPLIRLYYAALGRCPDSGGLKNWSDALRTGTLTLAGAADQFASGAEFLQRYGNPDDPGFVRLLYVNVLGRQADPAGLAGWLAQLAAGASRGTVLVGFSESDEFKAGVADPVEIIRLYYLLLQRMPTATELQSWQGFLRGSDQTDALFAQGYAEGLDSANFVQLIFQGFLRRPADANALAAFGNALDAGTDSHASMVNALLSSAEFKLYVAPVARLYLAAFLRVPDQPGLDNWVAFLRAGNSLQSAADAFVASQEFVNLYGGLSDSDYVSALYQNVLGRSADPAGLANWVALLHGGASRGQVLIGLSESPEAISRFAPSVRTFLHYFTFLNAPPSTSEIDYWNAYLAKLDEQMRDELFGDPAFTSGG